MLWPDAGPVGRGVIVRRASRGQGLSVKRKNPDHIGLLCDVGDLLASLVGSSNVQAFLEKIVTLVRRHLDSDVCSIYLYDDDTQALTLRATQGLRAACVGRATLKLGEGLTGKALKELRAVREGCASRNPDFKPIAGLNEEPYESFLAVPILRGLEKIGVLVVQREETRQFTDEDVMALRALASQLAGAIENARVFMEMRSPASVAPREEGQVPSLVRGTVASRGFAFGPASVHDGYGSQRALTETSVPMTYTLEQFRAALDQTQQQLQAFQERLGRKLPEMASMIFDAHLMILRDETFIEEIVQQIRLGVNPPVAIRQVGRQYTEVLQASPQPYIREKAHDVEDLLTRILANLTGSAKDLSVDEGHVVIARDLYPSDILKLVSSEALGVVLVSGGVTSHVSILARSLQLPMVIADDPVLLRLASQTPILLDTETGNVYINPSQEVVGQFRRRMEVESQLETTAGEVTETTATADGQRVRLLANVNLLSDLPLARQVKAEGIGLYRSEFPFLIRATLPGEEEQYLIYRRLIDNAPSGPVTFRTLDLGGDKLLAYYDQAGEENPALGLRSIRFLLKHRDIFAQQLSAVLRAGAETDLRIMFPMVSSVDDLRQAREVLAQCFEQLDQAGAGYQRRPRVGVMVEVPSAVEVVDALAREADFLCIGTNDLIQFLLAVDRTNKKVAPYFAPGHPAVLRTLQRIADAGAQRDKDVSICGEMAHDPTFTPFLLGIGLRTFSVDPQHLPRVQRRIAEISLSRAIDNARELLAEDTIEGVQAVLRSHAGTLIGSDDGPPDDPARSGGDRTADRSGPSSR
jgi:phosphotransferase system enzyme I (PtsP)